MPQETREMEDTDHLGKPVAECETDDTEILVWTCDPHPTAPGYTLMERSWHKFLRFMEENLVYFLERWEMDELEHEGVSLKIQLQRMRLGTYREEVTAEF